MMAISIPESVDYQNLDGDSCIIGITGLTGNKER
jgi:hypothetical protein